MGGPFGSNCPTWSVIGVLITAMMADSRSERAFEVRGGELKKEGRFTIRRAAESRGSRRHGRLGLSAPGLSVLGVLTAIIVDSKQSEWWAFYIEARGGEQNKKEFELSAALRSREVLGGMGVWI